MKTTLKTGFTLLEIMIVVAFIALMAIIAIPSFFRARAQSQEKVCLNNIRQLEGAKDQWALENNKGDADNVALIWLDPYIKGPVPSCPGGGGYVANLVIDPITCTILTHTL